METDSSPPLKTNGIAPSTQKANIYLHSKPSTPSLTPKLGLHQIAILAAYPITVFLGMISNHPSESYFALKGNFLNVFFLKFAWGWTSLAFFMHVARIPRKLVPIGRYAIATLLWYLVTQWCFGPPIMDKIFRGTGGLCRIAATHEEFPNVFTSAVCRSSGGAWSGGHDLSGHIFILTHGSLFLWWELLPYFSSSDFFFTNSTRVNLVILAIWWFSLLNSAIYFHTFLEKVTGLIVGLIGWYIAEPLTTWALDVAGFRT